MKTLRLAFIALALAALSVSCALTPFMPSGIGAENRLPAPWPELAAEGGVNLDFPDQFEAWLQDHLALRPMWMGLYAGALRLMGASSQEQVILGREGWLFFRETLGDYTGEARLTDNQIARLALTLETCDAGLRAAGSRLALAIVPNKASVYPEYMNPAYPRSAEAGNAERVAASADVAQVPLGEALRAHAGEGLYFRGDTHWNALGARHGARAILQLLSRETGIDIPLPDPGADFELRADWPGDLTRMLNPYAEATEPQQYYSDRGPFAYQGRYRSPEDLTIRTTGGAAGLKLTVLRDSFTNLLVEDISAAVADVTYLRAMPLPLSAAMDSDIALIEIVERRLPELLDAPPDMPAPEAPSPGEIPGARAAEIRLEIEPAAGGVRVYGALSEMPDGIEALRLGVRSAEGEAWYRAFPVSGDPADGDRGFSALLGALPEGAQLRVWAEGRGGAVCSEWLTPTA